MEEMWIARDKSGSLYLFKIKPVKYQNVWSNLSSQSLIPLNNKNRSPNSSISIKTMGTASERSVSTKNIPQKNSKVNKK